MQASGLPEQRRREYLAALGVPLFMARQTLPGAAASALRLAVRVDDAGMAEPVVLPDAAIVMPASQSPAWQPSTPPRREPAAGLAQAAAALQQARTSAPAVQASSAMPAEAMVLAAPAAAVVAPAEIPRFACRLLQVSLTQAVLLDLGEYPDLGPQESMLWQSVCRALGWQPQLLSADFAWPLGGQGKGGMIGQDSDAARAFLQGWLSRDLGADMRLFIFGPALAAFVERPHLLLPALAELLASPMTKRALWRQLAEA